MSDYMCFPLHPEAVEKEATSLKSERILYWLPATELRIRWNFATIFSHLRDPLAELLINAEEN